MRPSRLETLAAPMVLLALLGGSAPAQMIATAEDLSVGFRKAARRVLPAVVTVRPVAEKPSEVGASVVGGSTERSASAPGLTEARGGSGFVVDAAKGYILTNDHVVRGAAKVVVTLHGGRERPAKTVRRDPKSDLALVVIDPKGLTESIVWGDSEVLDLGDWVIAVGQPFGLSDTVTAGIVSGKGRGIGVALYEDLIQTDAAINPGNSGGPLVNLKGEVVGVNTAIKTENGHFEGVGFAVPAARAKRVARDLAEYGRVRRSFVGLNVRRIDPDEGERLERPGAVVVTSTTNDGPATEAGLRPGDVVIEVDSRRIEGPGSLQAIVETAEIGKPLRLLADRRGRRIEFKVVPRPQPEELGLPQP